MPSNHFFRYMPVSIKYSTRHITHPLVATSPLNRMLILTQYKQQAEGGTANITYPTWLYFYLRLSIWMFCVLIICPKLIVFCNQPVFKPIVQKQSITSENTHLLTCEHQHVDIFHIKLRLCESFTVTNSVTRTSLTEILRKWKTTKNAQCSKDPAQFSCTPHSTNWY